MSGNEENDEHYSDDDQFPSTPRGEQPDEINPIQNDQPMHVHNAIPPTFIGLHELCFWLRLLFGLLPFAVAYRWILMYRMIRRLTNPIPVRLGAAALFHAPFSLDRAPERNRIQPPWDDIPIETLFSPTVTIAVGENVGEEDTTPHDYEPIPDRIARQTVEIPDADDNNEDATNNEFEPMAHDFAGYANFDHIMINEVDAVEDDTFIGDVDGYDQMVRQALLDGGFDAESDISSDEGGNEADNESEATTTTSDSDSDARSETSSDNSDGTESGNDADDECSSTTTDNGSRRSSVSLPDNNDADVNEDATIASSNNEEEPAAPATDQPAALVQTRVNDYPSDEAADEHRHAGGVSTTNACRALVPYVRKSDTPVIHETPHEIHSA